MFIYLCLLITFLLLIPTFSRSQNTALNYKITQYGDEIGWLSLEKKDAGNTSVLILNSEVSTRIIFEIKVSAKESSCFENGKLLYSCQHRMTNGHTKINKQTKLKENKYEVFENNKKKGLAFSFIGNNLLSLYFREPVGIRMVFCETQDDFRPVTSTTDGGYKVKMADGSSNCFYYKDGVCTKIKVTHTFYSAEIILIP